MSSEDESTELRRELRKQDVQFTSGVPLDGADSWTVPDDKSPVLVIDSDAALSKAKIRAAAAGGSVQIASENREDAGKRYVTNTYLPLLGSTTRTFGLEVESGPCNVQLQVSADRGTLSTVVGAGSTVFTAIVGALTVFVARRRGTWLRRFLLSAPLGALAGVGMVFMLHETGALDPFGSLPWWLPLAGIAVAAALPLTRWPRQETPSDDDAIESETSSSKVPVMVNTAAVVGAALAIGATALVLGAEPAEADATVITDEHARVLFGQTLANGLAGEFEASEDDDEGKAPVFVQQEIQGLVGELADSDKSLPKARPGDIEIGLPPGQDDYPAWFVGSATIPHDGGIASVFARFDRASAKKPWRMTTFAGLPDSELPGPAVDEENHLADVPEASDLGLGPKELAKRYSKWTERQAKISYDKDGRPLADPDLAKDKIMSLRRGKDSFLRNYADNFVFRNIPPDLEPHAPSRDAKPGEDEYTIWIHREVSPDPKDLSIVPLADGVALVSFTLVGTHDYYNDKEARDKAKSTSGRCGPNPWLAHKGETYRLFAEDYHIRVMAWVPLETGDDEKLKIPVSDTIESKDRPSDRSKVC